MKKILKGLIPVTIFSLAISICVGIISNKEENSSADNEYSIKFDSQSNRFHDKSSTESGIKNDIKTASEQLVSFSYTNIGGGVNKSWHEIDYDGSFYNISRINGISSLEIKFKTLGLSFTIEWAKDLEFKYKESESFTSIESFNWTFNNYSPNYFRFINSSDEVLDIESMKLNFACVIKYPTVEITNSDSKNGDVYSSIENGVTDAGTKFIIAASGKNSHTFDGWYDPHTNKRYSTDLVLDLTVMNKDIYLEARYKEVTDNKFHVFTLAKENGTSSGGGFYSPGEKVTLTSSPNDGYGSLGWFYVDDTQDEKMKNLIYTFEMPSNDLCFVTKFGKPYNINYSLSPTDGGSISGPTTAIEGEKVTLTATPDFNNEYAFNCWKDENGEEISQDNTYMFTMPQHDFNISAVFEKGIKLTVISSNDNYGSVSGSGYYLEGRKVKIIASYKDGSGFFGWYDSQNYEAETPLLRDEVFNYQMGNSSATFYARFMSYHESHGVIPVIGGNILTYGFYPQSHVNDASLISELEKVAPKEDEKYFIYNNFYYVKDTGSPFQNGYSFSDGTRVISGASYFFKCEPITWNIISNNNGTYSLDCSNILYTHSYDDGGINNYKDSDIRKWLNDDFYNQAFFLNKDYIFTTHVDNSEDTTHKVPNPYACDDTDDNIYLKSYQDLKGSSESLIVKNASDFAICNHIYLKNNSNSYVASEYWTRSPNASDENYASYVTYFGKLIFGNVSSSSCGCSPAMTIKI